MAICEFHPDMCGPCDVDEGLWKSGYDDDEEDFEQDICFGNFKECCVYWALLEMTDEGEV